MAQDETWHTGRPPPWPHCVSIVLDGDPVPPPRKGHSPQFSAHICCGQMAGWIKKPLGTEVGLDPDHIVLDPRGPSSPRKRGTTAPLPFRPMSIVGLVATVAQLSCCLALVLSLYICVCFCVFISVVFSITNMHCSRLMSNIKIYLLIYVLIYVLT